MTNLFRPLSAMIKLGYIVLSGEISELGVEVVRWYIEFRDGVDESLS